MIQCPTVYHYRYIYILETKQPLYPRKMARPNFHHQKPMLPKAPGSQPQLNLQDPPWPIHSATHCDGNDIMSNNVYLNKYLLLNIFDLM